MDANACMYTVMRQLIFAALFTVACQLTITPHLNLDCGVGVTKTLPPAVNTVTSTITPTLFPPTPTHEPTPTQELFTCVAYAGGVNVRDDHSTLANIIGVLAVNQCVPYIAEYAGWYYVGYNGGYAWVAGWLMSR